MSGVSAAPTVRFGSGPLLPWASRCIKTGELDRAEELLGQLSDTHRGKRELTARLRRKQGLHKESWILLEQELFDQAHTPQSTLLSMLDYALAEKDPQRARLLADTAVQAGEIFDLSDYAVLSAPFQLAAAEQDGPRPWSCWTGFCAA